MYNTSGSLSVIYCLSTHQKRKHCKAELKTPSELGGNDSMGRMHFTFIGILILLCFCSKAEGLLQKALKCAFIFTVLKTLTATVNCLRSASIGDILALVHSRSSVCTNDLFSLTNFIWEVTVLLLVKLQHTIKHENEFMTRPFSNLL